MSGVQSRRLLVNFLLVLLVAGLGGAAWWFINKPQEGPEILWPGNQDITLITIERDSAVADAQRIRFENQDGVWQMLEPRQVAANTIRLRQLFTFLEEPVAASYDSAGRDLAEFGLKPGKVTLRFNDQQYVLGSTNSVSNNRYVLHDNQIKLVAESIFGSVTGDWVAFVDLKLVPEGATVKQIELPEGYQVTEGLLSVWQNVRAIRLEPLGEEDKSSGGDKVVLNLDEAEQLVFELGKTEDELVLTQRERGIRYFIPISRADELLPDT